MVNNEEMVKVRMTGGPPWGFRLIGGIEHGLPVSISKIRKRSKADYADLQEGDRVLTINGKPVRSAARDVAMAYVDDAEDSLELEVARTRTQERQTMNQVNNETHTAAPDRRTSNTGLPGHAVRKVTTTTTRIKTTADGDRVQETTTKTVMEAMDDDAPKVVSQSQEHRGSTDRPRGQGHAPHGQQSNGYQKQPSSTYQNQAKHTPSKPWQPPPSQQPQRHSAPPKIQQQSRPFHQQQQPPQQQKFQPQQQFQKQPQFQQHKQQHQPQQFQQPQQRPSHQKPKFEMPKPDGPRTDFAIYHGKAEQPKKTPRPSFNNRASLSEKQPSQPAYEPVNVQSKTTNNSSKGRELTITFALPDQEPTVDFGSPPQSPSGMSVDSGVPHDEDDGVKKPVNIMEDPSIILRALARDQDAPEQQKKMMRPFSEPAGRVSADEPEVSITEKRRACKTIADLLMFPKNKQARGARMFAKRRKRSARYTIEASGQQQDSDEGSDEGSTSGSNAAIITIRAAPPPPPPIAFRPDGSIPPPPPIPPGGFTQQIRVEPTNFNVKLKIKEKCAHNVVTPKQCMALADGLKAGSGGRAATMFEMRRQRSEQYVLDETTINKPHPKPPQPAFKKPQGPQVASSTAGQKKPAPWEATAEPSGRAFQLKPSKSAPPPTVPKPKPKPGMKPARDLPGHQSQQDMHMQKGSNMPKANFKDFNTKPRGWNTSVDSGPGSPGSGSDHAYGVRGSRKYSGSFNDFNPKPRVFNYDSPRHSLSPTASLGESDEL